MSTKRRPVSTSNLADSECLSNLSDTELWSVFHEQLDLDGNGHLDALELNEALSKAGIRLTTVQLSDFMTYLTSSPHSHSISFPEFRDFLLLLPRTTSTLEMYRYYAVRRFLGDDGHGVARVNMEGPSVRLKLAPAGSRIVIHRRRYSKCRGSTPLTFSGENCPREFRAAVPYLRTRHL